MAKDKKNRVPPLGPLSFPAGKTRPLPNVEVTLPSDELMAVAIAYGESPSSTTIKAKAHGTMAQMIIDKANAEGIFVHQDKELVAALIQMQENKQIPDILVACVAEVLVWLETSSSGDGGGHEVGFEP